MSFDRPHYLESVLLSLRAQTVPIAASEIFLFQDGYRSRNGQDLTDPRRIQRCMDLFETIFPGGRTFLSTENLGVAFNFARAENYFFEEMGVEAALFFEDDLLLSPHYLTALYALTAIALAEKRVAYVAAYGDHRASLAEQKLSAKKLIPMRHKWGFALTRRQWVAQREILEPYFDIIARNDYRSRDHVAIQQYFRKLGYGSTGTSQDGMKDVASCILGTAKMMTFACFGKYIGEIGLHSKSQIYDKEGFAKTEIYPDEVLSFDPFFAGQLDNWIKIARVQGKKALGSCTTIDPSRVIKPPAELTTKVDGGRKTGVTLPMTATKTEFILSEEAFARAMYRVFLLRDPDPTGLASAIQQLRSGRTYEELLNWCLRSNEFAAKYQRFLRTYIGPQVALAPEQAAVPLRFVPLDAPPMQVECQATVAELKELISRVGETWSSLGATRPYHSVLTGKNFLPENIDHEAIETFWATGSKEAARVGSILKKHGLHDTASKVCVEYGCGLGRITDPFANMFKQVYAYDISSKHLDKAKSKLKYGNVEFKLCTRDLFGIGLQRCDVFYSNIVFQHNPPPLIRKLISMALEALKPDAIAIFQVPTYATGYCFRISEYLSCQKGDEMEMHFLPQSEVFTLIAEANCELLEVREDGAIGQIGDWISNTFIVRRGVSAWCGGGQTRPNAKR